MQYFPFNAYGPNSDVTAHGQIRVLSSPRGFTWSGQGSSGSQTGFGGPSFKDMLESLNQVKTGTFRGARPSQTTSNNASCATGDCGSNTNTQCATGNCPPSSYTCSTGNCCPDGNCGGGASGDTSADFYILGSNINAGGNGGYHQFNVAVVDDDADISDVTWTPESDSDWITPGVP